MNKLLDKFIAKTTEGVRVLASRGGVGDYTFLSPLILDEITREVSFDDSNFALLNRANNFTERPNFKLGFNSQSNSSIYGVLSLYNALFMNKFAIKNVRAPEQEEDAANKKYVDDADALIKNDVTAIQNNYANKNTLNVFKETATFEKDINAKVATFATLLTPQNVTPFSPDLSVVNKKSLFNVTDAIEVKVNDIDGEQIIDKGNIELNTLNITELARKQESALKYRGIYDSTETYDLNDIVAVVTAPKKIDTYLSLKNNNTQPLVDESAWFKTPDLSVTVDLSGYYTKIETNDLLRPLQTDLDTINAQITEAVRLINENKAKILENSNNINTLNAEAVKLETTQTITGKKIFENGLSVGSTNYGIAVEGNTFEFKRSSSLTNVAGKDAIDPEHFITKKQFDEAVASAATAIATKKSNIAFTSNTAVWTGDTIDGKKVKEVYFPQRDITVDIDVATGITDCEAILDGSISRETTFDTTYTFSFAGSGKGSAELNLKDGNQLKWFVATATDYENRIGGFCKYLSTEVATRAEKKGE